MLQSIYESEFQALERTKDHFIGSADCPTNPLMLKAPESYLEADTKVMIFGQETNDWVGEFSSSREVESLLNTYDKFFNAGKCYKHRGPFFHAFVAGSGLRNYNLSPSPYTTVQAWVHIRRFANRRKVNPIDGVVFHRSLEFQT